MSVQSEIDRINENVANTYAALNEMGATMPAQQNSDNLPATARTVPQGGGTSVQTDWNQMDETAPDFLKNRPFGETPTVILEEQEPVYEPEAGGYMAVPSGPILADRHLTVVYDGDTYECKTVEMDGTAIFGNLGVMGGTDTGEPFVGVYVDGIILFVFTDGENHSVKISVLEIEKIPTKYYDVQTLFYVSTNDAYLYTDSSLTTKATKNQIDNAIRSMPIMISYYGLRYFFAIDVNLENEYALIETVARTTTGSFVIKPFHTAEYTP